MISTTHFSNVHLYSCGIKTNNSPLIIDLAYSTDPGINFSHFFCIINVHYSHSFKTNNLAFVWFVLAHCSRFRSGPAHFARPIFQLFVNIFLFYFVKGVNVNVDPSIGILYIDHNCDSYFSLHSMFSNKFEI